MLPVIAIVGRPNVGKSTLFNRLVGRRTALVDDRPGVTRDRHYGTAHWEGREFVIVDTGGFEPDPSALAEGDMFLAVRRSAEAAIAEADVVLFVVDRQAGLTPADKLTATILRQRIGTAEDERRILIVVNKCDGPGHDDDAAEFWALGFPDLLCISAEHGRNSYDLWATIVDRLPPPEIEPWAEVVDEDALEEEALADLDTDNFDDEDADGDGDSVESDEDEVAGPIPGHSRSPDDEIRIAVIGRPNIGKSTLVNRLVGEERQVVHDMPGTTMDAVDTVFVANGRTFRIVDTAGVRRKARIDDRLETFATLQAIRTIERCHVTILMIDGAEGITTQDARLASLIVDRGRACVLLINKWDAVRLDPERNVQVLKDELERSMPHMVWAPELYISALTGKGCQRILPMVEAVYAEFERRVSTARLNKFLAEAVLAHSPPQKHHHPVRLNYMTQARVRPPTFIIWANSPDGLKESYKRYLENKLRESFGFAGSPIRLKIRQKRRPGEAKQGGM